MPVLWPRIGEIQINAGDFTFTEYFRQILGIHTQIAQICQLREQLALLQCAQQHARIFFYSDVIVFRIPTGELRDETALAHSDFEIERLSLLKDGVPFSFFLPHDVLMHDIFAGGDRFPRAWYISQSHNASCVMLFRFIVAETVKMSSVSAGKYFFL